jgi:hypothetical protein
MFYRAEYHNTIQSSASVMSKRFEAVEPWTLFAADHDPSDGLDGLGTRLGDLIRSLSSCLCDVTNTRKSCTPHGTLLLVRKQAAPSKDTSGGLSRQPHLVPPVSRYVMSRGGLGIRGVMLPCSGVYIIVPFFGVFLAAISKIVAVRML